jgi:hypothetical protein
MRIKHIGLFLETKRGTEVNVKLPWGLINEAQRREDVVGSGGIAPSFLSSTLDGGERSAFATSSPGPIV